MVVDFPLYQVIKQYMKNSYSSILSYLRNVAEPLDEELNQPSEVEKNMSAEC